MPEVWLCPPGPKRVLDLIAKDANPESSLKGITGLKLYIGLMRSATQSELKALATLVQENKLKIMVEVGGTLNHDWQDQAGEKSAEVELAKLAEWYEAGGKVDYLDIDGPVWRLMGHPGWGKDPSKKFKSYDRCAKELMDYLSAVRKAYPEIQFFLLTNFPNWGYKKGVSYHATGPKKQHRGDYHEVVTAVMNALKQSGIRLAGATVDNPYGYFLGTHKSATLKDPTAVDWIARIRSYEDFCRQNNWEFNLIVNSEAGGKESDERFFEDTLDMVARYQKSGGRPSRYFVQSWYKHPLKIVPASAPYSMTALAKAVVMQLQKDDKAVESSLQGERMDAASAGKSETPTRESRPMNVLFILADDMGWRDSSVYGSTFYKTPNIDALAESGMRFTSAYAANPLCSPTRASILTGMYPLRTGLTTASGHVKKKQEHRERRSGPSEIRGMGPSSLNYLDPKYYTLGKAMKDSGYATGFFGKWHMGTEPEYFPENHGFDYVKGGRHHPGPPGKDPKRKFYPPWNCETLEPNPGPDTHVDDHIADLAIEFMKENKDKPFFLCYWAYSVHAPFQSKPELIEKWKNLVDPNNPQRSPTMAAMLEVLDTNVGKLTKALKDNGLAENTIVIFTSDNGGNMYDTCDGTTPTNNYPLRIGKGNNYEGGVRIPLVVRYPGVTKPGSVNHSVVSTVDHYPAILEMTRQPLRPDDHKDGVSYVPALRGEAFDRGPTICDMPHPVWATYNFPNTSVLHDDWKLYRFWFDAPEGKTHRHELYNLRDDIGETNDLSDAHPERVKELGAALDAYYRESGVLTYHPNPKYNKRTVGGWYATEETGSIAARDGALVLQSDEPGLAAQTMFTSSLDANGFYEFEARSSTATALRVLWRARGKKSTFSDKCSETVSLSSDWSVHRVRLEGLRGRFGNLRMALALPGEVEVRNARLLTADGSESMRYVFH